MLAGLVSVALIVALSFDQAGYFPDDYLRAGVIAFAVLALVLVFRPPHYRLTTHAIFAIGALVAFAGWIGLSAGWSPATDTALADMERTLVYVGIFGLGLVAAGSGRLSRYLVWVILGGITAVGATALLSRLYPDLISTSSAGVYRLSYPFGYWNALGAFAAIGAILGLGLAGDPRPHWSLRSLAAGASVLLVSTMYFSLSRGAWMSLAVGLLALVVLGAHRVSLLSSLALVGAGSALVLIRAQAYPGLVDAPTAGAGQLTEGHAFAPFVAAVLLGTVALQAAMARAGSSLRFAVRARQWRPLVLGSTGLLVAVLLVGYLVRAGSAENRASKDLHGFTRYVSRQWRDFMAPAVVPNVPAPPTLGTARLRSTRGSRSDLYRVALGGFADSPFRGEGSGSFQYRWTRERPRDSGYALDAHSLYLETLDELGIVGFVLLALFLGAVIAAAVRSRLKAVVMGRSQATAVTAAIVVWLVHAGVDWDWEMPALTGTFLVLAATLFPYGRRRPPGGVG
jgi:hypothetical protein